MIARISAMCFGLIAPLCLLLTGSALAAGGQMTDEQMQQMMENTQKMQDCMSGIDPSAMRSLEEKGRKLDAEVKALCAAGKRKEAQDKAIAYGKEMSATKEMKQMQKCGEMMQQSPAFRGNMEPGKGGHVCDGY